MTALVPNRFLFRFEFPLRYRSSVTLNGDVSDWPEAYRLPDFGNLDGARSFGQIWLAWNETGLFVACSVVGRRLPFRCDTKQFWKGDNFRLMVDMRDTRDIKRASRYCQQFYFLPAGGGKNGKMPVAGSARIHRATENAPLVSPGVIRMAGSRTATGYAMEAQIPAEALAGFDPGEHHRMGIYTMLEDVELGQQYLTVGDDLSWHIDPSTWATAVLTRD